jgi:transcriptional regulator with XRE-family HTH domain
MPVKTVESGYRVGVLQAAQWSLPIAGFTVEYVPSEEEERLAFRSRLGTSLARMRRQLTNYSQQEVADAVGIDIETYARIERGTREPRAYELRQITEFLGIPAEFLLDPTDSISEIDRRIAALRRVAAEAARRAAEDEQDPSDGGA